MNAIDRKDNLHRIPVGLRTGGLTSWANAEAISMKEAPVELRSDDVVTSASDRSALHDELMPWSPPRYAETAVSIDNAPAIDRDDQAELRRAKKDFYAQVRQDGFGKFARGLWDGLYQPGKDVEELVRFVDRFVRDPSYRDAIYDTAHLMLESLKGLNRDELVSIAGQIALGDLYDPIVNFDRRRHYNAGYIVGFTISSVATGVGGRYALDKIANAAQQIRGARWRTPTPVTPRPEYPAGQTNGRRNRGYRNRGKIETVQAYGATYEVPRTATGFIDFQGAHTPPGAPRLVPISQRLATQGSRRKDRRALIKYLNQNRPGWRRQLEFKLKEYRLHHHHEVTTIDGKEYMLMQLVLKDVHDRIPHTGGFAGSSQQPPPRAGW